MGTDSFPILTVDDMSAAVAFYVRLGFAETYSFPPEGPTAFVTLTRHGHTIGIAVRADPASESFAYWVDVDDVDRTLATLVESGSPVVSEPLDQPWGERVASVRDPSGNIVHLGMTR